MFEDDKKRKLLINRLKLLREPGVYVLYRDGQPYYVGKTTQSLFSRIHSHTNKSTDTYYHFWNFFSAFAVPTKSNINEVERILITALPTANAANPRIKQIALPGEAVKRLRNIRARAASQF
jgi:hypothetical protein